MHSVLLVKHHEMRVFRLDKTSKHGIALGHLATVDGAQLLMISNKDDLLGIRNGSKSFHFLGLRGLIYDNLVETNVTELKGLRGCASCYNYRDT